MTRIAELFERPIDRPIEEVIKVDQANEKAVATEIDEYVATDSIRDQFVAVLREIAEGPSSGLFRWAARYCPARAPASSSDPRLSK